MCGRYVTPDEAAMERAYNLTAIPCGTCVRKHSSEHLRSRVPRGTRDARGRVMGAPTAAARPRPARALRSDGGPTRGPRVRCRRNRDAMLDPISGSPMVGRFSAPATADSPRVMREK
jgi:hypothetical protein